MKIKNITAANMMAALAQIKEELGEDAIIISSENMPDGKISVTAAIEENFDICFDDSENVKEISTNQSFDERFLRECLEYHTVAQNVGEKIMALCRQIYHNTHSINEEHLLTNVFDNLYRYDDILSLKQPVKLFMGTPGSGKSTAIAKTATQAKLRKIPTCIISTDSIRAGANKQLEAFAKILEIDFFFCKDERSLYQKVKEISQKYSLILIDTPGINPFINNDVERVAKIANSIKNQAILTLDAGRNTLEAVEIAEIFANIGAEILLPTRLDLTRRIGSVLSVAACCNLSFCAASVSSSIANGLALIDSKSLAKLILTEI